MPSPERPSDGAPREQEPVPYYKVARFRGERPAGQAYAQAQAAIFRAEDCDLSAYRMQINRVWHVTVLGQSPPQELDERLTRILARGEPATLPDDVLRLLQERRAQAAKQGLWVERHHRPGERL
jgi:hypothetical protein